MWLRSTKRQGLATAHSTEERQLFATRAFKRCGEGAGCDVTLEDREISSQSLTTTAGYAMPFEPHSVDRGGTEPFADAMIYRVVVMTAAHAAFLLERPRPHAKRQDKIVRAYAFAMREHQWILNGMPIVISKRGVLLDGMQRLLACVDAELPFVTFLAEQIDPNAGHTIDQQRRRSFAGVLQARSVPHAHALQAALMKLMRIDAGTIQDPGDRVPSWAVMDRVLEANPWLHDAVRASLAVPGCLLPEAVRSPLVCMGYRVDRKGTDRLLDALSHPERYAVTEPGVQLRHEIQRGLEGPAEFQSTTRLLSLAIKSLDATLNDVALRRLGWNGPGAQVREPEAFPKLSRYPGLTDYNPIAPVKSIHLVSNPNEADECIRSLGGALKYSIEAIDPVRAANYLARNTGNRRISQAHVDAMARDMREGRWVYNAQPICFADNGRLMNGQHRLHAVIVASRAIIAPVVHGLDEAAYPTYDHHARRRAIVSDERTDFGDLGLAYAMANLLWRKERKTPETIRATATVAEVQQIIDQHPRLLALRGFARKMGHFGRASVIGYAAYVIERQDGVLASRFLTALETGANLGPSDPILALRSAMQKLRTDKASQEGQLAVMLGGWQRFKERAAPSGGSP